MTLICEHINWHARVGMRVCQQCSCLAGQGGLTAAQVAGNALLAQGP